MKNKILKGGRNIFYMKNQFLKYAVVFCISLAPITRSHAFFGSDAAVMVPYLIKLIGQAVKQYQQLRTLYHNAKKHRDIVESINQGLNEAIGMLDSFPIKDDEVLAELKSFKKALNKIEDLYGEIPKGKEELLIKLHDETVAESIKIANSLKEYADIQEKNSLKLSKRAFAASPKGAARANVQTNAAILHTLNQLLKVNGQMLKLQGEQLAITNKSQKESNYHYEKVNRDLSNSFKSFPGSFKTPKF